MSSFIFNNIDFSGQDYRLYVVRYHDPLLPRPRVYIEELSGADGAVTQGSTFHPRYLTLDCAVMARNENDRIIQVDNIVSALKTSQEGEKPLILSWDSGRVYRARLLSAINARVMQAGAEFVLDFIIPQPWGEAL